MTVLHKLRTAWSVAEKPGGCAFLLRLARARLFGTSPSLEDTHEQAARYCHRRAVDCREAVRRITGQSPVPLREQFASVFADADAAVAACPQRMGGGANLDLLHACARHVEARTVVETGVAYGWSSLALLLGLRGVDGGRLVSTNLHYREYGDDRFVGCAVPASLRGPWTILAEADAVALPKALALAGECDLCHYDSDKSYAGRMWAYPRLWNALRVGGCFLSDDIDDNLAFAHFSATVRQRPTVVAAPTGNGTKYVGILFKRDASPPRERLF